MDSQKQQVVERLKQANNILVTVSSNPSVDQLSACIGLTLALNKTGKHATAVFSGAVPSTIEFLQPEKTLEKNTDSLRDFIIALDKSKADKLRYKVEDRVVKIFITPYRTSITDKDLDFSQGDFNVDVVLTLGVHSQNDLDQAITAHGRILHDAVVMSVNVKPGGELGTVNWVEPGASSLSEMAEQLTDGMDHKLVDGQIATAFLTGIVAETERFSNQKTSPQTMSISASLMAAGANQQLVATEIEKPIALPQQSKPIARQEEQKSEAPQPAALPKPDDGTIEIPHDDHDASERTITPITLPPVPEPPKSEPERPAFVPEPEHVAEPVLPEEPELPPLPPVQEAPQIHIDPEGRLRPLEDVLPPREEPANIFHDDSHLITNRPMLGNSPMTANAQPEMEEPSVDPLTTSSPAQQEPLLNREPLLSQSSGLSLPNPAENPTPANTFAAPSLQMPQPAQASPAEPLLAATPQPAFQLPTPASALPAPTAWTPPADSQSLPTPAVDAPPVPSLTPFQPAPTETLDAIEHDVNSPHVFSDSPTATVQTPIVPEAPQVIEPTATNPAANVTNARDLVNDAINGAAEDSDHPEPIIGLNAQPGLELHNTMMQPQAPVSPEQTLPEPALDFNQPAAPTAPPQQPWQPPQAQDPNAPPASPPPMMPFNTPGQ